MKLQELMDRQARTFGRRNRIYLLGVSERINFLSIGIGDVQDGIRKGGEKEKLGMALARVVSRIFCVAEAFKDLPLVEMMTRKYPLTHCSYCGKLPCKCEERRANSTLLTTATPEQQLWSLTEWCDGFNKLYGETNKRRGGSYLLNRLFKEVVEIISLVSRIPELEEPLEYVEQEIALELSDTMAWTIAVSNFLEIDLEACFEEVYGRGCRTCNKPECTCRRHKKQQLEW